MSVARRISLGYATSLLGIGSGLLSTLWMLRRVALATGPEEMGVFNAVLQVLAYLTVLHLGLDFAASRHIAEELGRGSRDRANASYWELVRANRLLRMIFAAGIVITIGVLAARHGAVSGSLAIRIAAVAGLGQLIAFTTVPATAALIGAGRQELVNLATVGRAVLVTVIAVPLVDRGFGVMSVVIAELVSQVAAAGVMRALRLRYCDWIGPSGAVDREARRALLHFGGLSVLGGFAWTVESTSDVFILGATVGLGAVGAYGLWWRFPQMVFDLCSRFAFSAFPSIASHYGGDRAALRTLVGRLAYVTMGLASLALVGLALWLPGLMDLWLKHKYSVTGELALMIGMVVCLRALGNLLALARVASGKPTQSAILSWVQAGVKIGLGLAGALAFGLPGLLFASMAASLLQIAGNAWLLRGDGAIDGALVLRCIPPVLAGLAAAWFIGPRAAPTWLHLVAGAGATTFVWFGVYLVLGVRVWYPGFAAWREARRGAAQVIQSGSK